MHDHLPPKEMLKYEDVLTLLKYYNPEGSDRFLRRFAGPVNPLKAGDKIVFNTKAPQASASTGLRYNTGKPEMSMVLEANKAMEGVAKVLMHGKAKYHRGNWLGGLAHMGIVDCLMRHLTAYVSGEDKDAESGLPHVDHVLANALFLSQMYHTRPDLDDRVKL